MQPPGGNPPSDRKKPPPPFAGPGGRPPQPAYPPQPAPQQPAPQQPAAPPQPAYPQQPPQPAYPQQPPQPAYPQPAYPHQSQQPAYPQQPPQPAYPHQPPQPAYPHQPPQPAYPHQPQQPAYPQQPAQPAYPQQAGYPPQPAYPQQPPPAQAAPHQLPLPPPGPSPPSSAPPAASDHSFVDFLKISLRRAFRLRIDPSEVTPQERAALARVGITDPSLQAFLSWRRSVLFAFATLLVPLIVLKAIEVFDKEEVPALLESAVSTLQGLNAVALLVEVAFCALCWVQLRNWTDWRKQRRIVALGWMVFFLAPFVIYLYPLRTTVADAVQSAGGSSEEVKGAGMLFGIIFSLQAMIMLAPKAVSLIPGMVRSALVTKMLFPGTAAPGWLIVLAAPIYALFIYVVMVVPYQLTGSGYFVAAIIGIVAAQYFLGKGGYGLARPMTRDEVTAAVKRARGSYLIALAIGALFIVIALAELVDQLEFKPISVVTLLGTFLSSVWILTLIITDVLIANLDRARGISAGTAQLAEESNRQIAAFVSADLPPGPPPPS
ncbi:MAG: hypothetical protein KJZ91_02330 [Myxococcales bacterium]|nr:hypothetical protein [Myxococcales bacterium]